ncbi:MAG: T9SS C-terminal target domain-containing protein [Candidatus Kapaibacterium sp.]|nr:MAG: T9SS C-terminal target domain-containing protein [Candidatus Kapabacteria bacterium]
MFASLLSLLWRGGLSAALRRGVQLVLVLVLLGVGFSRLQAQNSAPLTAFPTFSGGTIYAIVVQGSTVYVGGSFTQVINSQINGGNTIAQPYLVAIDANTGAVRPEFNLRPNGNVDAMVSNGTRIFVGGAFNNVNNGSANTRQSIFSFVAATNTLEAWNPTPGATNGSFLTLALDGTTLYVGGNFTVVDGVGRISACSFDINGGIGSFVPNVAAPVLAIAHDAIGLVYVGGNFLQVNGNVFRSHFAELLKANSQVHSWPNGLYPPGNPVTALTVSNPYLLIGGNFNGPPNRLTSRDVVTGALDPMWNPNIPGGTVKAIAVDGGFVYAGGDFTQVNGSTTRNRVAAFPMPNGANTGVATAFNPNITGGSEGVRAIAASGGRVYVGGDFTDVGGQSRAGFAAFAPLSTITLGAAPANAYPMQVVTITGTNLNQPIGQVLFGGGVPSPSVRLVSGTSIEAVVPFGATAGPITVNTGTSSAMTGGSFTPNTIPPVATFIGGASSSVFAPANSAGNMANLNQPLGLALDATSGDMFIAEASGQRIRRVTQRGVATVFAGSGLVGSNNALGLAATFWDPTALVLDGAGNLYVSDYFNNLIRKITPSGDVTTLTTVQGPRGIVFDGTNLYVCSQTNHSIYQVTLGGVSTLFAGSGGASGYVDAMGGAARFSVPTCMVRDAGGNFIVTDCSNHRIRKITPGGNVTTVAGNGTAASVDGIGTAAQFNFPIGIAADAGGVLYVGDPRLVRMIQPNGVVTTFAGTGVAGNADGPYNTAQFTAELGGMLVKGDTLFVTDRIPNHSLRRIHIAKYQYVSGDAGVASNWRLLPGLVTPAPNFTGPGFQFILASGTATATSGFTLGANCVMTVKNGARLILNAATTNSGAMIAENGGTLEVSNGVTLTNSGQLVIDNGATGGRLLLTGTGAVASTTPVYGDAVVPNNATLESGGAAAKTLAVSELPSPMLAKLVISNTVGTTPPNAQSIGAVTGTVTVNSGGRLIIPNGNTLTHNNATLSSFTVNSGGFVEIQGTGQISVAASLLNYVAGSTLQYSGAVAKMTTTAEFPAAMGGNLLLTNTNTITINAAKVLGASATLSLNGGRVITTGLNMLTVSNTSPTAVSAMTGYVDGPLQRDMAANLTGTAGTYLFPVGVGADKYPFKVLDPTTGVTGPRMQVQAFVGNAMGVAGTDISALSTSEYWQLQQVSGNYTSGRVSLERTVPTPFTAINSIGGNPATANGTYNNSLSTWAAGSLTTNAAIVGAGYFLGGIGPNLYDWVGGAGGDWTVAANWVDPVTSLPRTTPAATDRLRFNAGTFAPINIPTQTIQEFIVGGDVTLSPAAAQTLTVGSGGVSIPGGNFLTLGNNMVLTQAAGATLQVGGTLNTGTSYVNGAGNFTLGASGILATSRADGINGAALAQGAVQCSGTVTYTAGASYTFNSASNAITTNFGAAGGKPAVTMPIGTLTTSGMNPVTLNTPATVNVATNINGAGAFQTGVHTLTQNASATLTVASSARLVISPLGAVVNNNSSGTSFTVQNTGTLEIQGNGLVTGASDVNYAAVSTLEYSGAAVKTMNPREIGAAAGVQNITISNSQPVTLGANALVQGSFIVNDGSTMNLSSTASNTLTLNGAINMYATGKFNSVNAAGASSLTIGGSGSINALRMDAVNNTLNNFTMNRTGSYSVTGDLNVRGTLDLQNGILQPTTRIFSGDPSGTTPGIITGGNTGSYVQGKLQRRFTPNIAAAGTNYDFPVGTLGTGYRPATLFNALTGAMSPVVEVENFDAGATTFDASLTTLLSPRNWRVQTMSGNFNGSALTLFEAGISQSSVVARSAVQAGMYQGFGGNAITTTVTSNAGAVPTGANHFFAVGTVIPTITGVSATTVSPGDTLMVTGTQLSGVLAVSIGGAAVQSFTVLSPTSMQIVVGSGSNGPIGMIHTGGSATSMVSITFNNAPLITGFTPSFGTTSSTVQITGQRLASPSNVSFGGTNALSVVSSNFSSITAVIGNGSSGMISVQNAGGIGVSGGIFDFILKPSIVNFFPKWAKAGDTVNIFGGNFQRVSGVQFGLSPLKQVFQLVTNGQIRILMPSDATTGLLRMENPVGQDSLGPMIAVKQPTLSSVQPPAIVGIGQTIILNGTEFHPFPVVQIGTVTAATLDWTSLTEMRVTFAQATIGNLTIFASGGTVAAPSLIRVVGPPIVTSFAPLSPLPGDLVTVTGANFVANQLAVQVNGMMVQNLARQSDNSLTFVMPNTTSGPIAVATLAGSTTAGITFQPLTVTGAQPMSALPATDVTLTGTRFTGITQVRFGPVTASQFSIISPTQLSVRVPLGVTGGTTSVFVTGAAGTGTLNGFTLLVPAPVITSFSPFSASQMQTVRISGLNFTGTTQVRFGGTLAPQFTVESGTLITATVPVGASSGSITVVNAAGTASRMGFTVLAPQANPNVPLSKFPTFNRSIFAIAVNAAGTIIYVGGDFTEATNSPDNGGNTVPRNRLAAIDARTGALVTTAIPSIDGGDVLAIVVDNTNNAVYVGGLFTAVNAGTARGHLLRFNATSGALDSWQTQFPLNQVVNGLSLNATNTVLYAVGGFTGVANNPGLNNGCGFSTADGTLSGFAPNIANVAQAVVVDGSSIKIAGHFAQTNGIVRQNRLASLTTGAQDIPSWNAMIQDGVGLSLAVDGGTTYVGGNFSAVGGTSRNRLCALPSANGNPVIDWNPNMNENVWAIAVDGANVYAGGVFTAVNGSVSRNGLAAFPKPPAAATARAFNPNLTGGVVNSLAISGTTLYVGGGFTTVGGQSRSGFAAFNTDGISTGAGTMTGSANPPTITDFSPATAAPMQAITLTGTNFTGTTKVEFGEKEAWFKVLSPTAIRTVVPSGVAVGELSITVSTALDAASRPGFVVGATPLVSTLAGDGPRGFNDSAGQSARLFAPRFGAKIGNNVYFSTVHAIQKLNLQTGEISIIAGGTDGGSSDGTGAGAQFLHPFGVMASDQTGGSGSSHLLVADYLNSRLRLVDIASGAVRTFAGTGTREYADGPLLNASFFTPQGLARDGAGRIFVTDHEARAVRFLQDNIVNTAAGNPDVAGSTNGFREDATFINPSGIVFDNANNAYIADRGGNRIRKISLETEIVTTLSGTGEAGFADGASDVAKFNSPIGLAINGTTLFVADGSNHRIRAVNTQTGEVVTVAGSTQGFADGTQQGAKFDAPHSLLWDNESASLIVFDTDNNRIRRVVPGTLAFAPSTRNSMTMTSGTVTMTNATAEAVMKIIDIFPRRLIEGENITLSGENISTEATVSIGALPLEIIEQSTTAIVVKIPNNIVPAMMLSTNARLVVTSPTVRINVFSAIAVTARNMPFISITFPSTGTTRDVISILGEHLAPLSAQVRGSVVGVSIGGVPVQEFSVLTPQQIQVRVGAVRSGLVQVRTLSGQILTADGRFTLDTTKVQLGNMGQTGGGGTGGMGGGGSTTATMQPVVMPIAIPRVAPQDSIALNRLFAATQGMQWATNSNWSNGAPVTLRYGVKIRNERVVEIRLPSSGLSGSIPPEVLQVLDKLEVLDLSNNRLSGAIPSMIANAQNLEVLNLQGNRFIGALPSGFCSMGKMRELNLSGNSIEDSVAKLCCLANATMLNLQGNKFTGAMPPCVQNLRALSVLNLAGNNASGPLPEALGQLRGLTQVNLRGNRFTGAFPRALAQVFTNPSAQKRQAVSEANEALGLEVLDLGENGLTGEVPEDIGNLLNLRTIRLDRNNFSGTLPKGLLSLNRLRTLDVSNNQFTGGPDLNTTRLDTLFVQNNRFSVVSLERFQGVRVYQYLPQEFVAPSITARSGAVSFTTNSFTMTINEPLTLSVPRTENFSRTQWRKNGIALRTPLDTNSHAELRILAFAIADTGVYDCVVSNDRLAGIVLTTAQIQIRGIIPMIIPTAVQLLAPRANEEDLQTEPRFRWTSSRAADVYRMELATDSSFATLVSSAQILQSREILTAEEVLATRSNAAALFERGFPLQNDRRHFWRVRAENTFGVSAWAAGTFTTAPADAVLTIGTLDMGRTARFDSVGGTLAIRNFSASAITLDSVRIDNPAFVIDDIRAGTVIISGGELRLNVFTTAATVGNQRSAITVGFKTGMSSVPLTRTMPNRLAVRVQAVKIIAPKLDTVIAGRRQLKSIELVNLSDEPVTVRSSSLLNNVSAFSLTALERDRVIPARESLALELRTNAATPGLLPEETLRIETIRGDAGSVGRENWDTVRTSFRAFARALRREDVFIRVAVKPLADSIAPGGAVTLEVLLTPLGQAGFLDVVRNSNNTFTGVVRWNPQVLALDPTERGVRRIRSGISTSTNAPASATNQSVSLESFVIPRTAWDGKTARLLNIKAVSVAGNTDVSPILLENFQWDATGSVNVESVEQSQFTAKPCAAGGKRLVTSAKATQLAVIAPNPAKDEVSISYTLREDGFVEILLVDMNGKTAQILLSEEQAAGDYTTTKALKNIPSGSYTVRLSTQNGVVTKRVNVVR